jgi:hypothetical protein
MQVGADGGNVLDAIGLAAKVLSVLFAKGQIYLIIFTFKAALLRTRLPRLVVTQV